MAERPGRARRVATALGTAAVVALVAACQSDATPVAAAEKRVTASEKALSDAEQASTSADAAFCDATTDYVSAIDRYGDVLHQSEPTVGDVRDAGADLEAPSQATKDAADAAATARQDVVDAQADLADAQQDLATAQAVAASEEPPTPSATEPAPTRTQTPASVTGVEHAEKEFSDTLSGITADTPLTEASEQFNAAVVGLEAAWLQLLAQSGCLSDDRQAEAVAAMKSYTTDLQEALADAGFYEGDVDGIYGPETVHAVESLQKENELPVTGTMDKASAAALQATLDAQAEQEAADELASTAALQQTLALAGYWDGPVDGQWTDELTDAVSQAQADLGVEPSGTVDAATIEAFEAWLATLGQPVEPSAEPTQTETDAP